MVKAQLETQNQVDGQQVPDRNEEVFLYQTLFRRVAIQRET